MHGKTNYMRFEIFVPVTQADELAELLIKRGWQNHVESPFVHDGVGYVASFGKLAMKQTPPESTPSGNSAT